MKQLFIYCDMEGASEITDEKIEAIIHGKDLWNNYGRNCITSDVEAICDAANEFGIDEILIYDGHYAGNKESNILIEKLPLNVKFVDVYNRYMDWRRIKGQIKKDCCGMIFVGQHARNNAKNAYFPHTIQSSFKELKINDYSIAEIGMALVNFQGIKFLANIGDKASMIEAKELYPQVYEIPVKDKSINWVPNINETYLIIKSKVKESLNNIESFLEFNLEGPFKLSLELNNNYYFDIKKEISWKGYFENNIAYWEAPSAEIGIEILWYITDNIKKMIN